MIPIINVTTELINSDHSLILRKNELLLINTGNELCDCVCG